MEMFIVLVKFHANKNKIYNYKTKAVPNERLCCFYVRVYYYSTVTDFAKFLGLSMLQPFKAAM